MFCSKLTFIVIIKGPRESRKTYENREITEKFEVNPDFSGFVIDANHEPVSVMEVKKSFPRTLSYNITVWINIGHLSRNVFFLLYALNQFFVFFIFLLFKQVFYIRVLAKNKFFIFTPKVCCNFFEITIILINKQ